MFEVVYILKDIDGYLKEKKAKFYHLQDAIRFVRSVKQAPALGTRVIGKPSIERI